MARFGMKLQLGVNLKVTSFQLFHPHGPTSINQMKFSTISKKKRFPQKILITSNLKSLTSSIISTSFLSSSSNHLKLNSYSKLLDKDSSGNYKYSNYNSTTQQDFQERRFQRFSNESVIARWFSSEPASSESSKESRWKWWLDKIIICIVFAITGSSALFFVRPLMSQVFQIEGSLKEGPWSYRVLYCSVMMPCYSVLLYIIGTLFGKGAFFRNIGL